MGNISDAQDLAIANATGTTTAFLAASGDIAGDMRTKTVTSGTAFQISTKRDSRAYINITTSASLRVELGPTAATVENVSIAQSSALGVVTVFVPAGWYLKLTGTTSNYVVSYVLS